MMPLPCQEIIVVGLGNTCQPVGNNLLKGCKMFKERIIGTPKMSIHGVRRRRNHKYVHPGGRESTDNGFDFVQNVVGFSTR